MPFDPKTWLDLPSELNPAADETVADWYTRIAAYISANPGTTTAVDAAGLNDLEDRISLAVGSGSATPIDLGGNLGASKTIATGGNDVVARNGILNAASCAITLTGLPAGQPRTVKIVGAQDADGGGALTINDGSGAVSIPVPQGANAVFEVIADWDGTDTNYYFAGSTAPDADASTKGLVQLTGDLGGTASSPTVPGLAAHLADTTDAHDASAISTTAITGLAGGSASDVQTILAALKTYADGLGGGGSVLPERIAASPQRKIGRRLWADFANPNSVAEQFELLGVNAVHTLSITGTPTGGTFTWTTPDGRAVTVPYNPTAPQLQALLQQLYGANVIYATGGPLPGTPIVIEYMGQLSGQQVATATLNSGSLTGGTSPTASVASTTVGGGGGWSYSTDSAESNRAVLIPNSIAGKTARILTKPEYSFRDFQGRMRFRVPASPHVSSVVDLLGRYMGPGDYYNAHKIWNAANANIQLNRHTAGADSTVSSLAQTDITNATIWHAKFKIVDEIAWFKTWKDADDEPNWQIVVSTTATGPVGVTEAAGRVGALFQVFTAGWMLSDLKIEELLPDDETVCLNGDFSILDSATGAPIGWTPSTGNANVTAQFVDVAGPDGQTRKFFHLARTVDDATSATVVQRINVGDYWPTSSQRIFNRSPVIPEWATAIEVAVTSKGTNVHHATAGSDFLGATVDVYQFDEHDIGLNIGQTDYFKGLGPDPDGAGTAGTGTWDWQRDYLRIPLDHAQNGGGRVAYINLTIALHDSDAVGDVWVGDIVVRPVA